ncbi:hypothetical protein DZF91_32790 [Actinomadura logoneensis]|uniref:Uncharacterized protein n=1 Tax=Actinomadura logoneensis TaxID=2293572 RepID=A0A372JC13_9ACTN|nr:hypothetical protein [Actinomadura logoneensis]RFU37459.1 hypothetical protein DZF91_32790 [Actinomadura logoneensis]
MERPEEAAWPMACGVLTVFVLAVVLKSAPWPWGYAAVAAAVGAGLAADASPAPCGCGSGHPMPSRPDERAEPPPLVPRQRTAASREAPRAPGDRVRGGSPSPETSTKENGSDE